jgi:hypothetical protein
MAVEGSSNDSISRKRFVGTENFCVDVVNPTTLEKANSYGYNFKEAPKYVEERESDGTKYLSCRIDFYLNNRPAEGEEKITVIHSIYIENRAVVTKDGSKNQYTNEYGQFAYLEDPQNLPENMSWFKTDGVRKAAKGEEALVEFIRSFANVNKNQKCYLETIPNFFKGEFKELNDIVADYPNNKVKINLVIKRVTDPEKNTENFYQSTFRKVERPYSKDMQYMKKAIEEYQENSPSSSNIIFAEYPYILKEFTGVEPTITATNIEAPFGGTTGAASAW